MSYLPEYLFDYASDSESMIGMLHFNDFTMEARQKATIKIVAEKFFAYFVTEGNTRKKNVEVEREDYSILLIAFVCLKFDSAEAPDVRIHLAMRAEQRKRTAIKRRQSK